MRNRADLETIRAAVAGRAATANDLIEELSEPVGGRAQGIAMTFGQGRVVVLGEAAMLSAQVSTRNDPPRTAPMGMNEPGNDNRQFVLNTLHWLSGLLKLIPNRPVRTQASGIPASTERWRSAIIEIPSSAASSNSSRTSRRKGAASAAP